MSAARDRVTAFLALGSNLGDRPGHLAHGLRKLGEELELTGVSSVYESDPVGYVDQPSFLTMVVRARTARPPGDLLELALAIEAERHRERIVRGGPRTLDIDVLLYGERSVRRPGLEVPHPRMRERRFVLVPLLELEPELTEPGTGRWYGEYIPAGEGESGAGEAVRRIMEGEELVNGES